MRITNPRVLRLFGFYEAPGAAPPDVTMPLGMWARCLWWKLIGRV